MNDNKLATNTQQRNRLLGALALLVGLALFCGFIGYAWNEPASASKPADINVTLTAIAVQTEEGGIIGIIVGGGTLTPSTEPTITPLPTFTPLPPTPTDTPQPPLPTFTPIPTFTPKPPTPTITPKPPTPTPNATGKANTATAVVNNTGTAVVKTGTAAVNNTATAVVKTGTAIVNNTGTAVAKTGTAEVNSTATADAKTATASAPTLIPAAKTGTAVVKTSTAAALKTGTAIAKTGTVVAGTATSAAATGTAAVNNTGTAEAATATEVVNETATAVAETATVIANNTATAVAETATAGAPTQTPMPTDTPVPTPTPVLLPTNTPSANSYDYTCLIGTSDGAGNACGDGYYSVHYEYLGGTWFPVSSACMSAAQCRKSLGPPIEGLPCNPEAGLNGILLKCVPSEAGIQTWNVRAEVNTACPINEVLRSPYPRAMVNVDTNFILQPKVFNTETGNNSPPQSPANLSEFVDADGNPTEKGYAASIWRDLVLIMRSERFNGGEDFLGQTVPKPQWIFEDRAWNAVAKYPQTQSGPIAKYNYQTSSAGLPNILGRAFDPFTKIPAENYTLPAYNVVVKTYCGHEWKVTVKESERFWSKLGSCYATKLYPDGSTYVPAGTSNEGCAAGYVAPGKWVYQWRDEVREWAGIDLTKMGRATTYDMRTTTRAGGVFSGSTYWDDPIGIWVPVIEVQSVLRDKCVQDGSCEPPAAEPDSLTK